MNSINLIGRLTKDVELRYTSSGKAVANATLAVDRRFQKDKTDFLNLVIWDKKAETLSNYTGKGSKIGVTGRVETDSYEKDGRRVYKTEIIVEDFTFLDSKNDRQGGGQQDNTPYQPTDGLPADDPNSLPF